MVSKDLGHRACAVSDTVRRMNDQMRTEFCTPRNHADQTEWAEREVRGP